MSPNRIQPPFLPAHRNEFPRLIDALGLKTAAEIGVGAGEFAAVLLRSEIETLWMVDDWRNPADREKGYRDAAYAVAGTHRGRAQIIEQDCVEFARTIPDESIDFVYLDTMHEAPWPMEHIAAWLPKARMILAGHDYVPGNVEYHVVYDIVPAVEELLAERGYKVFVTGAKSTRAADRLRVASEAMGIDAGSWGCNVPSWWILR